MKCLLACECVQAETYIYGHCCYCSRYCDVHSIHIHTQCVLCATRHERILLATKRKARKKHTKTRYSLLERWKPCKQDRDLLLNFGSATSTYNKKNLDSFFPAYIFQLSKFVARLSRLSFLFLFYVALIISFVTPGADVGAGGGWCRSRALKW